MIENYLNQILDSFRSIDIFEANESVAKVIKQLMGSDKILVAGNGGSSAIASHFVTDWSKGVREVTQHYPSVLCLSDNIPLISALANDVSYDQIFAFQIENIMTNRDILVLISGSGNSKNIIQAANAAKKIGGKIVALTGFDGGELIKIANYNFHVETSDMQVVEDCFSIFGHSVLRKIQIKGK